MKRFILLVVSILSFSITFAIIQNDSVLVAVKKSSGRVRILRPYATYLFTIKNRAGFVKGKYQIINQDSILIYNSKFLQKIAIKDITGIKRNTILIKIILGINITFASALMIGAFIDLSNDPGLGAIGDAIVIMAALIMILVAYIFYLFYNAVIAPKFKRDKWYFKVLRQTK